MDLGSHQWMVESLKDFLPANCIEILQEHVLDPKSPFQVFKHGAVFAIQKLVNIMWPFLVPVFDRLTQALHSSPDIVVLTFFLVLVFLVFQILNWMRRVLMFWTRIALRLVFWTGIVALVAVVWQRGLEASMKDAIAIGNWLLGYGAILKDVWLREYRRYEAQAKSQRSSSRGSRYASSRGRY